MPSSKDYSLENLPEGLRAQFHQVEQRLWRVETTTAVCRVAASLVISLLLLFLSDRLWDTSPTVRTVLFFAGLLGALAGGIIWARHWVWQRRDLPALAALVQKKYRRLGDRLLGVVELANEEKHPANFSPELYRAAIQQVAQEAEKFDFLESVNTAQATRLGWMAGVFAVVLLALCVLLPQAGANAFLRWMEPWANIARHTLVALDGFPTQLVVAHGEPFEIAGTVNYRSFWKPTQASGRLGPVTKLQTPVQSGKIKLQIPGQVEKGVLEVRVGDALARVQILPSHRPSLQQLSALIQLPDYLQYPDQTEAVQNGTLQAVEGSKISFQGTVSRPLVSASMQGSGTNPAPLKVQGQGFSSDPAELAGVGELAFTWQDEAGLTNTAPWRLAVQREPDAPPVPSMPDLPRSTAMLASDVLHINTEAEDDFGVRDLGLAWNVSSDAGEVPITTTEMKVEMPTTQQKKSEKTFLWSPALYRIPMDTTVELQAFAIDYFPGRKRSRSASTMVRILSPAEHAEMLRQEMEALMARLEDVTRLQEKIVSDLHGVQDAAKNQTNAAQSAPLNQSKEDQLSNAKQLDDMKKQGENTVREAMKNSMIPEDTIRQFSKTVEQWQQLSQEKMPEAANSMQTAAQDAQSQEQKSSPSSPQSSEARAQASQQQQKDTDQAAQQAQAIADELQKSQQKGNQDLDQLQALTLAERLRKVGGQEMGLSGQLTTNLADTIGLLARDLPDKFKQINTAFVKDQDGARDESASLQGEISRFFERTQKTNYGKVSQEMKETQATNELDRMGSLIQNNITVATSADLTNWAGRFQAWADELQPKSGGGGGGQGGGPPPLDLTKQLIELLRLREAESNLRDQTGVVDSGKAAAPNYKDQTGMLSISQLEMALKLEAIHNSIPISQFDKPFEQVADTMNQSEFLLVKPQTDAPTDAAERESVDGLSDLINLINEATQSPQSSGQKPSDSPGTSAEEMAFLTSLMKPGNKIAKTVPMKSMGGGNMAGGTTSKESNPLTGNATGPGAAARNVHKAAAGALENYPVEFRDALENYFHAVEK